MAYVSPIKTAQGMTAGRLANERAQQLISQSAKAEPLELERLRLSNKVTEMSMEPKPMSVGDQEKLQERETIEAADFFHSLANAPSEFERHAIISNKMHEARASGDPQKWANAQRFYGMSKEEQDQIGKSFFESPGYLAVSGGGGSSDPTLVSEAKAIFGEINENAKKWMLQQREKGSSNLTGSAAQWDQVYSLEDKGDKRSIAQARDLRRTLTSGVSQSTEDRVDAAYRVREAERQADLDAIVAEGKQPGTPEYDRIAKRNEAERIKDNKARSSLFEVEDSIDLFEELMQGSTPATSGIPQAILSWIPNSNQYDFEQMADAAKSRIALGAMDKLKRESQTGSTGFGQLSDKERLLLEKSIRSLETSQSTEAFKKNLKTVLKHYRRMSSMMKLEYAPVEKDLERRVSQMKDLGLTDEDIEIVLVTDGIREPSKDDSPKDDSFTGRTATNSAGDVLRETEDGRWVE